MVEKDVVPGENVALSYQRLRGLIGWIGLLLPISLVAAGAVTGHFEHSISAYYYTGMTVMFTGTLCLIGVFLLAYRIGDNADENWATSIAGVAALGVAFFHAAREDASQTPGAIVHLICAVLLFVLLAFISWTIFPRDVPEDRRGEACLYKTLGAVMVGSLVAMALLPLIGAHLLKVNYYEKLYGFFVLETVCVIAFSVSFLVKGRGVRLLAALRQKVPSKGQDTADGAKPAAGSETEAATTADHPRKSDVSALPAPTGAPTIP